MSVQQEHLTMKQAPIADHTEAQVEKPPKLEYSVKEADESLEAYISAISGAIIGVLATLLVLYILNGGTLRFTNPARLAAIEASLTRVDENVGAVNQNVETVATRLAALEGEAGVISQLQTSLTDLDASLGSLDTAMAAQGVRMDGLDESVAALDVTRKNFDTFTAALASALSEMGAVAAPLEAASGAEAPAVQAPAAPVTEAAASEPKMIAAAVTSAVAVHTDLAADAVQVILFVDANGDGALDDGEAALVGATVTLTPAEGEAVSLDSAESGALFEALAVGEYTVSLQDVPGYTLGGETSATVTVEADAEAGQVVYFAVAAE
ncbi:MAG: hypothetical protein HY328_10775 [Chloroflexi bacterium]|nr:hypothetical protein [Chloroflexota bacterium]